jgi:hypothetical protein
VRDASPTPPPTQPDSPARYLICTTPMPDGGTRAYYSYSAASARAAQAALARDPTLLTLLTHTADTFEDTP